MPREDRLPLRERAKGKWRGLLPQFGISPRVMNGKHHPCPSCGGKDRFRFDDKGGHGTYYCSGCGAGDGIKLVGEVNGWDFKTAAQKIEAIMGDVKAVAPPPERSAESKRKSQRDLWNAGRHVTHKDPVGRYLESRLGEIFRFPRCLRYSERTYHMGDTASYHPAMLAMVQDVDGLPVNIHRTYLSKDGRKADLPEVRKMMSGDIPKGSAVRLFPFHEDILGVAEGLETAWAAHLMHDIPVWSTINAQMLAEWEPPKDVKKVVIFGDNDASFTGQWASYSLAKKLKARQVDVEVLFPPQVDWDFNNVWQANFFTR